MRRDPTQFRERFKRWKEGKPAYKNGKAVDYQPVPNTNLPEVVVTPKHEFDYFNRPRLFPSARDTFRTALLYNLMKSTGLLDNPDPYSFLRYKSYSRQRPMFPMFEDGKDSEVIYGGTPFEVTVTTKDKRSSWKKMYDSLEGNLYRGYINDYRLAKLRSSRFRDNVKQGEPGLEIVSPESLVLSPQLLKAPFKALSKEVQLRNAFRLDKSEINNVANEYLRKGWILKVPAGDNYYYATAFTPRGPLVPNRRFGNKFFISYGEPWRERRASNYIVLFPSKHFGDLQSTDMLGMPNGYDVKQVYRQMVGLEKPTFPEQILKNLLKGLNQTVIPAETFNDVLYNGGYRVYYSPSKEFPGGAIELHIGR